MLNLLKMTGASATASTRRTHKQLTARAPIRRMPFPAEVVLPLRQHAGKPARLLVKKGDHVERGDKMAEADGFVSVPIHASAAGTVVGVGLVAAPRRDAWRRRCASAWTATRAQLPRPRTGAATGRG